jgi:hypothetical protein
MKLQIVENPDYILAISDEEIKEGKTFVSKEGNVHTNYGYNYGDTVVVAYQPKGNAPELDLPLLPQIVVEDGVETLPYDKLCYYDTRNSDFQIKEEYGYDKEEVDATGEFPKKDCACDNCFYGRAKLADRIIKSATKVYSEEDLGNHCIDFLRYFQTTAELGFHSTGENHGLPHNEVFNKYIQSLKQPKWFVVEMDCGEVRQCMCENNSNCLKPVFKTQHTTKNGTTYLVGTYEY